nr:Chain C, Trypsin inhibitor 1 [Helianthus annuus]
GRCTKSRPPICFPD